MASRLKAKRRKIEKRAPTWTVVGSREVIVIDKNDVLGSGAFGKVFSGRFNLRPVAVKRMDRDNFTLFRKEIAILSVSFNDNVVKYFSHDVDEDYLYLGLEKCDCDLAEYMREFDNDVGGEVDKEIMYQAACGLAYLHSKNIVHRDVKLSNFLVKIYNDEPIIKITDFGISRILDPDKTSTAASLKGTFGYNASEILRGLRLRKVSDVFALGIVFYKILTEVDDHPFGDHFLDIEINIRDRLPPDLSDIKSFPQAKMFRQLIAHMLEHDTGRRYKSSQVKKELEYMD